MVDISPHGSKTIRPGTHLRRHLPRCGPSRGKTKLIPTFGDGPPGDAPASLPLFEVVQGKRTASPGRRFFCMAFTETYHCDVCGNPRGDAEDWWLALTEPAALIPSAPEQPMLRLTPWNVLLSHAAKVRHLCGARCAQTLMDRWMRGE